MDRQSVLFAEIISNTRVIAFLNQASEDLNDDLIRIYVPHLRALRARDVNEFINLHYGVQEEDYHWDIIVSAFERSFRESLEVAVLVDDNGEDHS